MSEVIASIALESQLGSPPCASPADELMPHSDCSNNATSVSDTASPRSDDKSSVSGEDTSSLPAGDHEHNGHTNGSEDNIISDGEETSATYMLQVKGLPRFYRLGVSSIQFYHFINF